MVMGITALTRRERNHVDLRTAGCVYGGPERNLFVDSCPGEALKGGKDTHRYELTEEW